MVRWKGPARCSLIFRGMVKLILHRLRQALILRLLYPSSALTPRSHCGLIRGRPRPERLTAPWTINSSNALAS